MRSIAFCAACVVCRAPSLQAADLLSGTWTAGDGAQARTTFSRSRGIVPTGIVCGPCDDPASVSRIEDGRILDANRASHPPDAGRRERVEASMARERAEALGASRGHPSASPSSISLKRVVEDFELGDWPLPAA